MKTEANKQTDTDISQIAMFVIDVLRHDIETVPLITNLLNKGGPLGWRFAWPHDFTKAEVTKAVEELLNKEMIRPLQEDKKLGQIVYVEQSEEIWSKLEILWFELTQKGWQAWEAWDNPPIEEE